MKKFLVMGFAVILSAAMLSGCGKSKAADKDSSEESKETAAVSSDDLTYDLLFEANNGYTLLEKYDSVEYKLTTLTGQTTDDGSEEEIVETWDLFKSDGDYVISRTSDAGEDEAFLNGTCYYKDATEDRDNPKYSKGWFMDGVYDEYMEENIKNFLISESSEEDFDKIEEKDGEYVILSYAGENDNERYYYRYTVDKSTLEIQSYEAVIMRTVNLKTEEQVVAEGSVKYGKKVELPDFIKEIEEANVNKRTVTLHQINEDGQKEKDIVVEIPENSTFIAALQEGYGLYLDEDAKVAFDDTKTELNENKVYPDSECYLIYTGE